MRDLSTYTFGDIVDALYRLRPYLQNATEEELAQRTDDVLRNLYTLTADGRLAMVDPDDGGDQWAMRLNDLRLEHSRRGLSFVDADHVAATVQRLPFMSQAVDRLRRNRHLSHLVGRAPLICRYGGYEWISKDFEGRIQLKPASYYHDDSLDAARRDTELSLPLRINPYDYDLDLLAPELHAYFPRRGWHSGVFRKPGDHYIFCVSRRFDFRYFFDFGHDGRPADSCLVIHDDNSFHQRIVSAVQSALPSWNVSFEPVYYYDPYWVDRSLPYTRLFLFKQLRFVYQREWRLVAYPRDGTVRTLAPLPIDLGSLRDIGEIVTLVG